MRKIALLLLLSYFFSCNSRQARPKPTTSTPPVTITKAYEDTLQAQPPKLLESNYFLNSEYLDDVKINNQLPLFTTIKNVEQFLGKADSVVTPNYEDICDANFYGKNYKYAYYKGIQYESYKDSLIFCLVNFYDGSKIYIQGENTKLDASTTLSDLEQLFPIAAKSKSQLTYHGEPGEFDVISLDTSQEPSDGQWLLFFQDGKLKKIILNYDC